MSLNIMYFLIFRKAAFGTILGQFWVHFGSLVVLLGRPWGALGGLGAALGAQGRSWDSLG